MINFGPPPEKVAQAKAAETRFENDVKQAKGMQPATKVPLPQRSHSIQRRVPTQPVNNQRNVSNVVNGPRPVGHFQQSRTPQSQVSPGPGGPDSIDLVQQEIDIEEFVQSPVVQSAVTRAKLSEFFRRDSEQPSQDYASKILASLLGA